MVKNWNVSKNLVCSWNYIEIMYTNLLNSENENNAMLDEKFVYEILIHSKSLIWLLVSISEQWNDNAFNCNQRYEVLPHTCQAIIKILKKCWQGYGKIGNPCTLLMGMLNDAAAVRNSLKVTQKIKKIELSDAPGNPYLLWVYIQRIEIRILTRHLQSHDLCSLIHNSPDMENNQMFINRRMDKEKLANMLSCF